MSESRKTSLTQLTCLRLLQMSAAFFFVDCAGGPVKLDHGDNFGSSVPKEVAATLGEQFEVRDYAQSLPAPSPSPSVVSSALSHSEAATKQPKKKLVRRSNTLAKRNEGASKGVGSGREQRVTSGVAAVKKALGVTGSTGAKAKRVSLPLSTTSSAPPPPVPVVPVDWKVPNRRPAKEPIWVGESHLFSVGYLGVQAGTVLLEVLPFKMINNRKVYHVRGTAESSTVFAVFYRLHDIIETFFDFEGLFSHRLHVLVDESKQARDALELNDSFKKTTYFWNRWNHVERGYSETKETAEVPAFSQDSLSAMFYLRTVPLPDGAVVKFPVISEGRWFDGTAMVVRREKFSSPLGELPAVVLKIESRFQGVLQNKGDSFLWLSDDDRRFVLRLEAKVKIGAIYGEVKEIKPGTPP